MMYFSEIRRFKKFNYKKNRNGKKLLRPLRRQTIDRHTRFNKFDLFKADNFQFAKSRRPAGSKPRNFGDMRRFYTSTLSRQLGSLKTVIDVSNKT